MAGGDARAAHGGARWGPGAGPRRPGKAVGGPFADLLDEDPDMEVELRALVKEIQAQLPTRAVSAVDHSLVAGLTWASSVM